MQDSESGIRMRTTETCKPPTESLLPPPYSYEELYSSYQNEWDQKKSAKVGNCLSDETTNVDNIDVDESVADLKWVTVPKIFFSSNESETGEDDGDEKITFLIACTGSGEIVVWKLGQQMAGTANNNSMDTVKDSIDATVILVPYARWKISEGDNPMGDRSNDENYVDGRNDKPLFEMHITPPMHPDNTNSNTIGSSKTRIRKRPRNESQKTETEAQEQFLIVAGDDGLWSIPLSEILMERQPSSPSFVSSPPSLVRLSDRSISQLQSLPLDCKLGDDNHHNWLFGLEKDANNLMVWNLGKILPGHNENNRIRSGDWIEPEAEIDLTRWFSDRPPLKFNKRRRFTEKSVDMGECATTILVSKSDNKLNLLVGTDRSKIWILPLACSEDDDVPSIGREEPRFFSLNDGESSSKERSSNATARQQLSDKNRRSLALATSNQFFWKVSNIIETNDGTWWTASAVRSGSICGNNHRIANNTTGLLVTWHAPSGMVMARRETREAIQAIRQQQRLPRGHSPCLLYSAGNEAAVSTWDSSFSLERTGRFWASPPSGKAIAIEVGTTRMAIAGVGNWVDLFVDHCRVQTVRI